MLQSREHCRGGGIQGPALHMVLSCIYMDILYAVLGGGLQTPEGPLRWSGLLKGTGPVFWVDDDCMRGLGPAYIQEGYFIVSSSP